MCDKPTCALVIGHRPSAPGAVSVGEVSEYDYNSPLARLVAESVCDAEVQVLSRDDDPSGYARLPAKVNATGADFCIEMHFNAAASSQAHGTEMLCWETSHEGRILAGYLLGEVVQALSTTSRGVKPRGASQRGSYLLMHTEMPCVIAEPFFGSNALDWDRAKKKTDELTVAYKRAIDTYASRAPKEGFS